MIKQNYFMRICINYTLGIILSLTIITETQASSSQLYFNNASGLGNAYAGEAAVADDASTEYSNPAGLSRLDHPQFVVGNVEGRFDGHFVGTDTYSIPGVFTSSQTGFTNGKPVYAPYPFAYYSRPINQKITLGFGLITPFGNGISIPEYSRIRYAGTRFVMYDIDFSPAIAYRANEKFSVGLALDIQQLSFYFRNMAPSLTGGPDAKVINDSKGWGLGWHTGLLYQISPAIRAGLAFHSQTVFHPSGKSEYIFTPDTSVGNEIVSNSFHLTTLVPATTTLSIYDEISQQWALMGTVGYSMWSSIQQTVLKNIAQPNALGGPGVVTAPVNQYYRDTWRIALGSNYKINTQWMLRLGMSFETDPTNDTYRPLTDPGTQAISIAAGVRYQALKSLSLDAGYLHAFIRSSSVNTVSGLNTQYGQVYLKRDALGLQATWNLA